MTKGTAVTGRSAVWSWVGRIQQRHPALGPQFLDLVKVLADPGRFLGRDAPTMGQAPLHPAPAAGELAELSGALPPLGEGLDLPPEHRYLVARFDPLQLPRLEHPESVTRGVL
jgi:hypothetical protein